MKRLSFNKNCYVFLSVSHKNSFVPSMKTVFMLMYFYMEYVHTHTTIVTINSSKVMYIHSAGLRHLNDDRSNSSICLLNIDIFQAKTCMDFYGSVFISKSREVLVWDSLWSDLILDRQKFDWIWHITPTYNLCHGSKNVNFVNDKCYFHSSHCFRFELTYFD